MASQSCQCGNPLACTCFANTPLPPRYYPHHTPPYGSWQPPLGPVFSSSKETDALRRGNLSPTVMEMLQILKFIYRKGRVSFADEWVATEEELSVI
ncbi:hypothetical protein DFH09DRAFT_1128906, partial [Mycena vulgaris]